MLPFHRTQYDSYFCTYPHLNPNRLLTITDHFGGVMGILNTFGRHIEVGMLEAPDHLLSLTTIRELRARGLIGVCEQSVNP